MFGSGIGELNVYVNQGSKDMKKIWSLSGDAGNNWYMGQAPISSIQPYKVSKSKMWMIKAHNIHLKSLDILLNIFFRLYLREPLAETAWVTLQ